MDFAQVIHILLQSNRKKLSSCTLFFKTMKKTLFVLFVIVASRGIAQFDADYKYVTMNPAIGFGIGTSN